MQTINYINTEINKVIIHSVGNRLKNDTHLLSDQEVILGGEEMEEYFLKTTLKPFKNNEFFTFNNTDSNSVYSSIQSMMDGKKFVENSKEIAKHLFETIDDPKADGGNIVFVKYKNVVVDDTLVDAIGIFKLKKAEKRFTIHPNHTRFEVDTSYSYDLSKIDKGVMIYNYDSENGYLISVLDKHTKSDVMQYWSKYFLDIIPRKDTIYYTNNALDIVERYVLDEMSADVKKIDKINLLNETITYCNENDEFDYKEFAEQVFGEDNEEFLKFRQDYELEKELVTKDSFYIDEATLKKRAKKFKTIIKLDDNFDIVIKDGSDNMITHGTDKQGRKYYKLFYQEEG
ncbi:MAG: nucleoid-associated protein [Firmicutes bacterium]|nr:nucleoid-associated protein [Bacillota bacterium]